MRDAGRGALEAYRRRGITSDARSHGWVAAVLDDLHAVLVERGDPYGLADRR